MTDDHSAGLSSDASGQQNQSPGLLDTYQHQDAKERKSNGDSKLQPHSEPKELKQDAGASPRHTMQSPEDDKTDWGGMVAVRAPADMPPEQIGKALAEAAMISADSIVAIERAHAPVATQGSSGAAGGFKSRSSTKGDHRDGRSVKGSTHGKQQLELYSVRLRNPEHVNKIAGSHTTRMALLLKHSPIKVEKTDRPLGEHARHAHKNVATASLE